jgi:hypothetical protein
MELSLISRSYRLTQLQPVRLILKDALSGWLLRELDRPSTSAVNANEDSREDMTPDGDDRNGELGTGSDITVVENLPKSASVETSKCVESKCPALLSRHSRRSPASLW